MTGSRLLSLANLSALAVPPPDLVRSAAEAGFDAVGALRLLPASDGSGHDLLGDARLQRRTSAALAEAGLRVLDVEVLRLRPGTSPSEAEPLLALGAELGASFLLCTVEDHDVERRADAFAAVCALGSTYGLRCVVEPMVFAAVRTPQEAVDLLRRSGATGAGLLVDALHLARAGCTPADLVELPASLLPYLQVCDAATDGPAASRAAAVVEAVGHRLAPGEGVLPLAALLRQAPPGVPVSVEAPSPRSGEDAAAWVRHLATTTRRLLEAVDAQG